MNDESRDPTSRQLNQLFLLLCLFVAVMFMMSAYAWPQLAENVQIPLHWGFDGQPDRYGGKGVGLSIMPGVAFLICLLFRLIPIFEPRRQNLLRSLPAYRVVGLSMCLLLLGLHAAIIGSLLGLFEFKPINVIGILLPLLLIIIGNYSGKIRSNFLFGIRTPWTLSSDLSWNRTHRMGGRLLMLTGIIGIFGQLVLERHATMLLIGILIPAVLFLIVYSYLVWRDDPDRQTSP